MIWIRGGAIDPQDAEYILEEDDLVIIDDIRAWIYSRIFDYFVLYDYDLFLRI